MRGCLSRQEDHISQRKKISLKAGEIPPITIVVLDDLSNSLPQLKPANLAMMSSQATKKLALRVTRVVHQRMTTGKMPLKMTSVSV